MKCITVHLLAFGSLVMSIGDLCMWSCDQNNEKFKLTLYHGYDYYNLMYNIIDYYTPMCYGICYYSSICNKIDYYSLVSTGNNIGYYSQMCNNIDYYRLICITIK